MTRYIVMTRSAQMPSSCWGVYKRLAVVETDLPEGEPKMISERARGMVRIVREWEDLHYGKTEKCAYGRALAEAEALADHLNAQG